MCLLISWHDGQLSKLTMHVNAPAVAAKSLRPLASVVTTQNSMGIIRINVVLRVPGVPGFVFIIRIAYRMNSILHVHFLSADMMTIFDEG